MVSRTNPVRRRRFRSGGGRASEAETAGADDAGADHRRGGNDRRQAGARRWRRDPEPGLDATDPRRRRRAGGAGRRDCGDDRRARPDRRGGGRGGGRRAAGDDRASRGRGLRRGRGGFREGLRRQLRRHADAASRRSGRQPGLPPAGDLRLLDRGLRRAVPGDDPRGLPPDAADQLRHAEGDERAAARRLLAPRLYRRHRPPAADDLHPARARRTRRPRASSRTSCASRWPARRRCCRSRTTCGTGTPARARRSASSATRCGSTSPRLGPRRSLAMPGLSATVAEQIEALRRAAGDKAVRADPRASPTRRSGGSSAAGRRGSTPSRALALGFAADASFDAIIAAHVEDELGGRIAVNAGTSGRHAAGVR